MSTPPARREAARPRVRRSRPPLRVTLRYFLFQVPGWLLGAAVAFALHDLFGLDALYASSVVAALVVKDLVLFPFVWPAYADDAPLPAQALIGEQGEALETLAPSGYVRVSGEMWKARVLRPDRPLRRGTPVRVVDVSGLTLVVADRRTHPRDR